MPTNYPTALDDGTSLPTKVDGDIIYAAEDNTTNDAIKALEAKLGITSSAVTTSADYKLAHRVEKENGGLETVNAIGTSGSSKTLAVSTGNIQTVTNSASCTYTMPSGLTSGVGISFTLIVTNNGAFTATFTGVKWAGATAPVLTSGSSKVDIFTFLTIDGGTTWYGFVGGQNMS